MKTSFAATGLRALAVGTIFGFLSAGPCVVAAAEPGSESRTVRFADLDLSSPSGVHVVYRRIRAAAEVACSHYFFWRDADKERCVRDATADAVIRIDRPALSAVYNANNRGSVPAGLMSQTR